jgi:polyisoprenyl-phosphate glycosyltransferase
MPRPGKASGLATPAPTLYKRWSMEPLPLVTIVCPVYNEEESVEPFYRRLMTALEAVASRVRVELLFVNNRSTDRTLDIVRGLSATDPRVGYVTLARNFGYQASITAGMRSARGDCVVNIDVDCEDPPEMIPKFIDKWLAGADIAYGIRSKREEFVGMHLTRKLFYRLTRRIADHEIILDMAEFFLVDKRVRDAALASRSTFPFVRGQVGYTGFRREGIPYKRERRMVGRTHYNLAGAVRFGAAGILSSSTMVLRLLAYVALVLCPVDAALAVLVIVLGARYGLGPAERWLGAAVLFHFAWFVLALGALGIYLARVYKDSMGLPLYIIDERLSSYPHG